MKNKFGYLAIYFVNLLTLTGESALAQQTGILTPEFAKSYSPLVIPSGTSIGNETGESLYLLNYVQYKPLYDLWEFSNDTAAFYGNEYEAYSLFQQYLNEQDSLLAELGKNTGNSRELNLEMYEAKKADTERIRAVIDRLETTRKQLLGQQQEMAQWWERERKHQKKSKFWLRAGSYTVAIGAGAALIFLTR